MCLVKRIHFKPALVTPTRRPHPDATSSGSHEAGLTAHEDFRLASRGTPVHENIAILTQEHHVSAAACPIVHNIK